MKNALTIDLEEWYHPELVRRHVNDFQPQISKSTNQILQILKKHNVKATFFVLGDVAKKNPQLIKQIYDEGHEIASHGMSHIPLWNMNQYDFDKELKQFKNIIRNILGTDIKINGFRAPTFSIDNTTKYGVKCLINNGFQYDSSVFPIKTPLYGISNAPNIIYKIDQNDLSQENGTSEMIEFPLTVFKTGHLKVPISGGFYLRIIPYFLLKWLLKEFNKKAPFVIYFHPWETYLETPRIKKIGLKNYLITYYGINKCLSKIERLLQDFEFGTMNEIITREEKMEMSVKEYFEKCADRFDGYYKDKETTRLQQFIHNTLRKPGLISRFEAVMDMIGDVKGKTILDVGCGSGIYSVYLEKNGAEVNGIDFSSSMISLAIKNAKKENSGATFTVSDFLDCPDSLTYDFLLFVGFFDYLKKSILPLFLNKAVNLTKGGIIATFPKKFAFQTPLRYYWLRRQNCPVYFYTKHQIKKLAAEFSLEPTFFDCGPIWTVKFTKHPKT